MELFDGVHLVASGSGGFDLTDPFDCHAYLVTGATGAVLIDSGIGTAADALVANVERAGVERDGVRALLLTHAHPDHSGGARRLKELLPALRVLASPYVRAVVERGDEAAMSLEAGKRAEFYPAGYRFQPCELDGDLRDGERVEVGDVALTALDTPGHSAGHFAFLADLGGRRTCFSGDLVFYGGQISLENNWDCSLSDYARSIERLAAEPIDALLPGHHSISLARGGRHVEAAWRQLQRGFVPRSIV